MFIIIKAFYQKETHSFQKNALLFIFFNEFEGALFGVKKLEIHFLCHIAQPYHQ